MSRGRYYAAVFVGGVCVAAVRTKRLKSAKAFIAKKRRSFRRIPASFRIGSFRREQWVRVSPWKLTFAGTWIGDYLDVKAVNAVALDVNANVGDQVSP